MRNNFVAEFALRDSVTIDRADLTMVCVVTGVAFYDIGTQVLVAWLHNGESRSAWIEDWRLTRVEE